MNLLVVTILFVLTLSPLLYAFLRPTRRSAKIALIANIASVFALTLLIAGLAMTGTIFADGETAAATPSPLRYISAAAAVGMSCLGGGIAVSGAASSAIGAISENPKIFGQSLIMVVLAEGIAIYGLIIAVMILNTL